MAGITDFLRDVAQGGAQAVPGAIKQANEFELQARSLATRDKANQIQQRNVKGLNKVREQQTQMNELNLVISAHKAPKPTQSAMFKFLVKNNVVSQDYADLALKAPDETLAEVERMLADKEISVQDLVKFKQMGMADLIPAINNIEKNRIEREKMQAVSGTPDILRGGTAQVQPQAPSGLPSLTAALPSGVPRTQQQIRPQARPVQSQQGEEVLFTQEELEGMSDVELARIVKIEKRKTQRKGEVNKLVVQRESDSAKYDALLSQTDALSSRKAKDVLARMKFTEQRINQLQKGFPTSIARAIAGDRAALAQIKRIQSIYNSEFTGPVVAAEVRVPPFFGIDIGRKLPKFKKRTKEEFGFRAEVGLLKVQLRKKFFGAAQTAIELKGSLDSIPDIKMLDAKFEAALETTKRQILDHLIAMEEVGQKAVVSGANQWEAQFGQ